MGRVGSPNVTHSTTVAHSQSQTTAQRPALANWLRLRRAYTDKLSHATRTRCRPSEQIAQRNRRARLWCTAHQCTLGVHHARRDHACTHGRSLGRRSCELLLQTHAPAGAGAHTAVCCVWGPWYVCCCSEAPLPISLTLRRSTTRPCLQRASHMPAASRCCP